jgi:hypothetical protein
VLSSLICVYLTCKTEELRIPITKFLENIQNNPNLDQTADILLSYELLLIEKLQFELVIHTAYRPFEGLIIDLKVYTMLTSVRVRYSSLSRKVFVVNLVQSMIDLIFLSSFNMHSLLRHIIYVIMLQMPIDYV